MGDFESNEVDFHSIVEEIEKGIKLLKSTNIKKNEFQISNSLDLLKNRLNRARQIVREYKIDIREIEKVKQPKYTLKSIEFEEKIKSLENDLMWLEKQVGENIHSSSSSPPLSSKTTENQILPSNQFKNEYNSTISEAKELQKDNLNRVNNILQEVTTMGEEGQSTLEEMGIQEEKIINVDNDFNQIDANLKLANRQIRVIARKLATDKIIMDLILLIVLAVIFVIVWSIVKPKSNPKVRDQFIH
eukprot:gene4179-5230_t